MHLQVYFLLFRYARTVYVFILPMGFGFGHIGRVGSVFITVSVTIERYFAIVHPLKHFSGKRFLLVIPILSSVLYNIPKFYELERQVCENLELGQIRQFKWEGLGRDSFLVLLGTLMAIYCMRHSAPLSYVPSSHGQSFIILHLLYCYCLCNITFRYQIYHHLFQVTLLLKLKVSQQKFIVVGQILGQPLLQWSGVVNRPIQV